MQDKRKEEEIDKVYEKALLNFNALVKELVPIIKKYGYSLYGGGTQFNGDTFEFKGEIQVIKDFSKQSD